MNTAIPDVPAGALAGSTFEEWDNEFRTLYSTHRSITGPISVVTVYASAIQRPNGTIEDGTVGDAPRVWCDFEGGGDGMVTSQARELAAALLAAADLADRWVQR